MAGKRSVDSDLRKLEEEVNDSPGPVGDDVLVMDVAQAAEYVAHKKERRQNGEDVLSAAEYFGVSRVVSDPDLKDVAKRVDRRRERDAVEGDRDE